ncbi:MAG: hypothetical protein ACKO7B_00225, partial [Flavobacteriales bacterium]
LGQSVPIEDLYQVYQRIGEVQFISLFTTQPVSVLLPGYLRKLVEQFSGSECEFHLTGGVIQGTRSPELGLINVYSDLGQLLNAVTA